MSKNWKGAYNFYKKELLKLNPKLNNESGIYIYTRTDEDGIKYFYVGQSVHILDRCISHMTGYQHIDLSLKKRGLFSEDNPLGWKLGFLNYPTEELDKWEQHWIKEYTKAGYQCRYNKTAGGQGEGKEKINDYRPAKNYRDGLEQGKINCSREISHLFDLHLNVSCKSDKPNKNQEKALNKFQDFLDYHKKEKVNDKRRETEGF